jgi:thiopeptide-type bacteriocin biosynthesis protein
MARARQQDFVVDQSYKRQTGQKFRDHRQNLAELLREAGAEPFRSDARDGANRGLVPAAAIRALSCFSSRLAFVRGRFEDLRQAGELTMSVPELASSFVHMHLNRMFRSRHQEQERMVCEFLSRTYASVLARLRIRK